MKEINKIFMSEGKKVKKGNKMSIKKTTADLEEILGKEEATKLLKKVNREFKDDGMPKHLTSFYFHKNLAPYIIEELRMYATGVKKPKYTYTEQLQLPIATQDKNQMELSYKQ